MDGTEPQWKGLLAIIEWIAIFCSAKVASDGLLTGWLRAQLTQAFF